MEKKNEFMKCDGCRIKPGSPILCAGCLNNRMVIHDMLEASRRKEREVLEEFKHFVASQEDESLVNKPISTRLCTLEWINSRLASLDK